MQPAAGRAEPAHRSLFDPQKQFTLTAGPACPDGESAVTLHSSTAAPDQYAVTRTETPAASLQNKMVQVRAQFSVQDVQVNAGLWGAVYDGPKQIMLRNTQKDPIHGSVANVSRTLTFWVPPQATRLVYGVMMQGAGTVNACGLEAGLTKTDTALTDAPLPVQTMRFVLDAVRTHALHAGLIDWNTRTTPLLDVAAKGSADDLYAAIRSLLSDLKDGHSFVMPPVAARTMAERPAHVPEFQKLPSGIGLIAIPFFTARTPDALKEFVQTGRRIFAQAADVKGWIVDLRGDKGGNMWPMLQALQPLLGSGNLGFFEDLAGKRSAPWRAVTQNMTEHEQGPDLSRIPVAVLIGPNTASAGEAVAIALKGRPETRFFGAPTHGQTTANKTFQLPDGGMLAVAAEFEVDRTGKRYEGPVEPDEILGTPDAARLAAEAWLGRVSNPHK